MKCLCKFVEIGRQTNRIAYATGASVLPDPTPGSKWLQVEGFNAATEALKDPALKEVFKEALEKGWATVERDDIGSERPATNNPA